MRAHIEQIRSRGADVVAIGTGNPAYAKDVIEKLDLNFLVLIDADAAAARAAAVRRGTKRQLIGPAALSRGIRNFLVGGRQGKPGARISQLGATFVIAPGGEVRFEHYADASSDNPPIGDVLAALPTRQP